MSLRRVAICTPSMSGTVDAGYAIALVASVKQCLAHGIELVPLSVLYDDKHLAQNDLLAMVMAAPDITDIVWIDADIDWSPDWILRLLIHPVDVVGGTYLRTTDDGAYEVGPLVDAAVTPAGLQSRQHLRNRFLRMSRAAFAALWDAAPTYRASRGEQRYVFRWDFDGDGQLIGEGASLCRQLRRLGFSMYLDPTMTCVHVGTKRWHGDYAAEGKVAALVDLASKS